MTMMPNKLCLSAPFLILSLLTLSCMHTVTQYREETAPETRLIDIEYKEPIITPRYKTVPPVFPLPENKPMVLAILPFTNSSGMENAGVEIAEEIEYRMLNYPGAAKRYRLLNRTQIQSVMAEQQLGSTDTKTTQELHRLLNVEGLITGHVRAKSPGSISFILKAINTKDASILISLRIEGNYDQALQDAVNVFYDQRMVAGYDTTYVIKTRKETQTVSVKKEAPYDTIETNWPVTILLLTFVTILGVMYYSGQSGG